MSLKLMVRVMEDVAVTRPEWGVLLAMAEHADDEGCNCYPSIDKIAWKCGYKPRNVVDIIRGLVHSGVLELMAEAQGRRAAEYRIHLNRAQQKPDFEAWQSEFGRHSTPRSRGAVSRVRGANSREPENRRGAISREEGCNLTSLGVQSHVNSTREIAPEPLYEPYEPSVEPGEGARTKKSGTEKLRTEPTGKPPKEPKPDKRRPKDIFEVIAYMRERGCPNPEREAERWWNHKESNGWRVGKNPIADWRATVRTWLGHDLRGMNAGTIARREEGWKADIRRESLERLAELKGEVSNGTA